MSFTSRPYVIYISSVCHLHLVRMSFTSRPYVIYISSVCHLHLVRMSFTSRPYVIYISSVCHLHLVRMSFTSLPYVIYILSVCHLHLVRMSFTSCPYVIYISSVCVFCVFGPSCFRQYYNNNYVLCLTCHEHMISKPMYLNCGTGHDIMKCITASSFLLAEAQEISN